MASRTRSADIYETLAKRILTWTYPPGHRLTEEELCAEFSASRSPVREALNSLVSARLLIKEPHKGYTVRKIDIKEINELYDTRIVLELEVLRLVCMKGMDADTLHTLRQRWQNLLDELPKLADQSAREDELFHETLAAAAGNKVMQELLLDIDKRIHFVRLSDITDQQRLRITCLDHLELLDAIEKQDFEHASLVLQRNIAWGKEKVDAAIREALIHAHKMG